MARIAEMTAADLGLETATYKPLYPYCREFLIYGFSSAGSEPQPLYVESTLWR